MSIKQQSTPSTTTKTGPSLKLQRTLAMLLLIAQGAITVTGAIVRVTGSGLGCDTWPNCQPGSLVPVEGAAPAVHQAIEFGNRMLTFVLVAICLAVFISVLKAGRSKEIITYAVISGVGIIAQAVIGGISVLLDLRWWAVALHFLPSMILVWVAALLYMRLAEPDDAPFVERVPNYIRQIGLVAAIALVGVLVTGTMVTGSGVHSGDAATDLQTRLQVDTETMAFVHAGFLYVYLTLTLVTVFLLYTVKAPKDAQRTGLVLVAFILVQWVIGVIQFHLGIPRWTVPVHIGMSSAVVAFTAFLYAHGRRKGATAV